MFDIGFWELFLTALIALIVLGPERLPGVARTLGLWIGRARAAFYSVREEVEREINADGLRETQRALRRRLEQSSQPLTPAPPTDAAAQQYLPPSQAPAAEAKHAQASAPEAPPLASSKDDTGPASERPGGDTRS
ncbi:MAG TPA: Sec-independent protein translocase protein TatB [Nitrococcus sp.]|nr:Sec-independent protein translocase protein TatB [Nitrococcus sp.]